MFELYSTGMKTQQLEEEDEELFICHIHSISITRSEMCALLLTHPRAHHTWRSGLTHTHLEQWNTTLTQTGAVDTYTPGAVDTHLEQRTPHTHTHTHTWSSGHTHTWSSGHTPQHTHTHTHTHTHLEQWAPHTHTHLEQWETHTHTHHTHTHTWSSGQSTLRRPGGQLGVQCLAQGSHLSCGHFLPEPRTHNLSLQVQRSIH